MGSLSSDTRQVASCPHHHFIMVVDNNGASVDEASILANFFNLQADKHGPELLRKLNRIGAERWESVQSQQSNEEQRHEIKIEVEAENVIKHEVKLDQERSQAGALNPMSHNKPDSGLVLHSVANPGISFLVKNESDGGSNRQIQYVMSQDGKLLSMLPDAFLNSLPLLPNQEDKSQGFSARQDVNQCGSVSVIQRAPPKFAQKCAKFELNNPNIILERRVHLGEVGSGGNTLANVANMANSTGSIPGTRVRLPNGETRRQIDTQNQNVTGAGSRSTLQSLIVTPLSNGVSTSIRGKKSNQQQSDHLICEVCGERAGKHSYYGGQVCPSCRAFFRRSVQSRYNETFKCTKGREDCHINLMTRKNCQYCRYQKCIGAGMRPSWILSDEERVRRFHGRNISEKSEKSKKSKLVKIPKGSPTKLEADTEDGMIVDDDTGSVGAHSSGSGSDIVESFDPVEMDRDFIAKLSEMMTRVCTWRHDDIERHVLKDLLLVTLHGSPLSISTAAHLDEIINSRSRSCLQLIPEFQSLCPSDQAAILENNLPLIHRFRQAVCLHAPFMSWSRIMELLLGPEIIKNESENLPTDLSGSPKKQFKYEDLFTSPWCPSEEVEKMHKALMEDISSWVDYHDHVQHILIILILAFNHDFLDLKGRSQVEKIQLKYVILLQTHLRSKYSNSIAASKLTKAVMLPAVAREIVQVTKKRFVI